MKSIITTLITILLLTITYSCKESKDELVVNYAKGTLWTEDTGEFTSVSLDFYDDINCSLVSRNLPPSGGMTFTVMLKYRCTKSHIVLYDSEDKYIANIEDNTLTLLDISTKEVLYVMKK